jgi:7-cyano-7-deazaguanine synthase
VQHKFINNRKLTMKKAVVLLSGGLDSATVLAITKEQGYNPYPISFDYSQRHKVELEFAKKQVQLQECEKNHLIIKVDLASIGGSALTDTDIEVPKNNLENSKNIPITYVPARNTIFLSLALAYAESIDAFDIFIGANCVDYSNYPDCRPQFIEAFEKVANLGTKAVDREYKIHAPLIKMSKAEIIKKGLELGLDYSKTLSCYNPSVEGKECGECDSCLIRNMGFSEVGVKE